MLPFTVYPVYLIDDEQRQTAANPHTNRSAA